MNIEVDGLTLRDVLPKCFKSFLKDFSVDDVKDSLGYIFNKDDMQNILAQRTEEKQNLQLFWILQDNETLIPKFLNQIDEWYPWLSQQVYDEVNTSKDNDQYFDTLQRLRLNFEKHVDWNVHRMKFYWPVRLALLKLRPYNFLVVSGELGIGKKWILLDVCSEYEVMKTMGFNIFWLDVYNCNCRGDDFKALQQLQLLIEETGSVWRRPSEFDGIENKILHLQQRIRERLQQDKFKNCLLVLSGVQNSKSWKNLNLGCKIVIITRNQKIFENMSESSSKHIHIGSGFTPTECFQYFEKVLKRNRSTFPEFTLDIFSLSHGRPLLLSIIANNLKLSSVSQVWSDWKTNLENGKKIPDKLTMFIEISLKGLKPELIILYKKLSIFPHSVKIPLKLLASFWKKTELESESILGTFYKYSIINRSNMPDESVAYILPYIYSLYLKAIDQNTDQSSLHSRILDYYRINKIPEKMRDNEVFPCNDYYFYHCIGYHLKESNNLHLFPKLFLDFTFLGDKLRYDSFSSTIGDLKHFETEITGGDSHREKLLSDILTFLPHADTVSSGAKDANLLQYALMADGLVKEEALRQARLFERRTWFEDKGHFHQRRQVVRLPEKVHMIKSVEADICVIALKNNNVLLVDLSLDYNNDPVYLTGNQYPILQMNFVVNGNYIIMLDIKGNLNVWSIMDDRRRSACLERKVNPLNLMKIPEMQKRECKQFIGTKIRGPIKAFHIEALCNNEVDLHVAFKNGDICIYSWDPQYEEFKVKSLPTLPTKEHNICYLSKILNKYYMVLNKAGDVYFFNICDSSKTAHSFEWTQLRNLIYVGESRKKDIKIIIFVCSDKVLFLSFPPQKFEFLKGDLKLVYNIDDRDNDNSINCACVSHDGRYLVLGTKCGLIVFNIATQSEVLRGNISESIACMDVYPLDDHLYKYLILCASDQSNVLSLFALKELENDVIAWSYRPSNLTGTNTGVNNPQLEPDVWLQGNKLFDFNRDYSFLVAVDSKNRIHQVPTTDEETWSISLPTKAVNNNYSKITAITMYDETRLCSYDNGNIFDITKKTIVQSFTDKSISYLELINDKIFVASSEIDQKSSIRHLENEATSQLFDVDFFKCFTLFESYAVLISPRGRFIVTDLYNNFKVLYDKKHTRGGAVLGGCDLKNDQLVLVTSDFVVLIYKFVFSYGNLEMKCIQNVELKTNSEYTEVTSVACSFDNSLLALGMQNGLIEVYRMETNAIKFIFHLASHELQIYDLKFSPKSEVLVSCSEQLCFWHVPFMLNNPFDTGTKQKRRSSRFQSPSTPEEESGISLLGPICNSAGKLNPWSNKLGIAEKPELLSCIKFFGNKAEIFFANDEFTNFYTIDNEGVYYHLCLLDINRETKKTTQYANGCMVEKSSENETIT